MKDSLITKLDTFHDRFEEISALLSEPEVSGTRPGSATCRGSMPSL